MDNLTIDEIHIGAASPDNDTQCYSLYKTSEKLGIAR